MDAEAYHQQLLALLPVGKIWELEEGSNRSQLLKALADEFARIDARIIDLIDESDPRTTFELLTDWERVTGMPGPCAALADTIQGRRDAVEQKLTSRGGQSRQFLIDAASSLGFVVTITEFKPFRCGISRCGDRLYDSRWWFAFRINAPAVTIREFRCGQSVCGEPLRSWGNEPLECQINELKPAHTTVIFAYGP